VDLEVVEFSELFNLKITKATYFLLPLLSYLINTSGKKKGFVQYLVENLGLNNVYLKDNLGFYKYCLFLSFKKSDEFVLYYKGTPITLEDYLVEIPEIIDVFEEDNNIIYVYQLPKDYYDAYDAVINGNYSYLQKYNKFFEQKQNDIFIKLSNSIINKTESLDNVIRQDLLLKKKTEIPEFFPLMKEEEDSFIIKKDDVLKLTKFLKRCLK
jgi:hypothetical protein